MMAKTKTTRYDIAEHLRTREEMAAYLEASLEVADGNAAFVVKALGDIVRAKGMAQMARDSGLSRESLNKALSGEGSPDFDIVLKVVGALGLKLHVEATHDPADPDVAEAWRVEIERRDGQIERGEVELVPGDEVIARLRRRFR
jgi:probable addiction module antidote protein